MSDDDEFKARSEANRKLRMAYTSDPDSLTEDEKTRAMALLQRDKRKLRQQSEKIGKGGANAIKPVVVGPASGHLLRQQKRESGKASKLVPPPAASVTLDKGGSDVPTGLTEAEMEAWKVRSEANRMLRQRYAKDPSLLTEEEQAKALVLLQRDQRKLRQSAKKKKEVAAERAARPLSGDAAEAALASKAAKPRDGSSWMPQADASTVQRNIELRTQFKSNPESLPAEQRQRAEILIKRDEKKKAKKERLRRGIAKHREKSGEMPDLRGKATAEQMALAKKWGIAEKLAAAGVGRLKKGLKRGDWECSKCKNNNFAKRTECMKCGEAAPKDHDRWITELKDPIYWASKEKEQLTIGKGRWDCPRCTACNSLETDPCFRCSHPQPVNAEQKTQSSAENVGGTEAEAGEQQEPQSEEERDPVVKEYLQEQAHAATEEWRQRSAANARLREAFTNKPDTLTEDEKQRAMALLQRDARKLRQQQKQLKKQDGNAKEGTKPVRAKVVVAPVIVPGEGTAKAKREAKRAAQLAERAQKRQAVEGGAGPGALLVEKKEKLTKEERKAAKLAKKLSAAADEGRITAADAAAAVDPVKAAREAAEGPDWICRACGNINWGRRDKCNRCPETKIAPETKRQKQARQKKEKQEKAAEAQPPQARSANKPCVLGRTQPEGPGDPETKMYTCGGCGSIIVGYAAWRKHMGAQKKRAKRQQAGAAERTKAKNEQRKRQKLRSAAAV